MTKIGFRLDTAEIARAVRQIKAYRTRTEEKARELVSRLADEGISVGMANRGEYGAKITFSKKLNPIKSGCQALMLGTSAPLKVQWRSRGGVREADIMPILMAEFGSGPSASDATGQPNADKAKELGMGQGTFPGQTHAFEESWTWQDLDGHWHESSGVDPTMPMFKAAMQMRRNIQKIAKAVFAS